MYVDLGTIRATPGGTEAAPHPPGRSKLPIAARINGRQREGTILLSLLDIAAGYITSLTLVSARIIIEPPPYTIRFPGWTRLLLRDCAASSSSSSRRG